MTPPTTIVIDARPYVVAYIISGHMMGVECETKEEFYVCGSSQDAGATVRDFWEEMAATAPDEFEAWRAGRHESMTEQEFFDHVEAHPREFIGCEGIERHVDECGAYVVEALHFEPRVAYLKENVILECDRCGHRQIYRGHNKVLATCGDCGKKINIKKCRVVV